MTEKERQGTIKRLKARLECGKREVSGKVKCIYELCEDCDLCYEQGNMGERNIDLKRAIEALETEAIPIEWLEKKIAEKKSRFCGMCDELTPVFVMYEQVIADWREENERATDCDNK